MLQWDSVSRSKKSLQFSDECRGCKSFSLDFLEVPHLPAKRNLVLRKEYELFAKQR